MILKAMLKSALQEIVTTQSSFLSNSRQMKNEMMKQDLKVFNELRFQFQQ